METLENTLSHVHDWAVDRIHYLCERDQDISLTMDDAYSIQCEFSEWLDPNIEDHNIFSLEYIGDDEDGNLNDTF
jgi:hypothetical protein